MNSIRTPKDHVILVPTDFSTASGHAFEHAVGIAKLYDSQITLLYVIEESFFKSIFGDNIEKSLMMDRIDAKLKEKAAEIKKKHYIK